MGALFLKIVSMSLAASWLILAAILLRFALKKAPKWINCALWALAAVRLVCPFSLESPWSLIPRAALLPEQVMTGPSLNELPPANTAANPFPGNSDFNGISAPANHGADMTEVLALLWIIGMVLLVIYALISYRRIYNKVRPSLHLRDRIWLCDDIATPFLLGFWRPRIYIPSGTGESWMEHIIAHEQAHLKRRDHWWKLLGFLVLAIHWFNPLVWVAYILLCRDIELACDEKVIRDLGKEESIAYSKALLSCSVSRRTLLVCPLAFGEVGVKERVKRVLNYKKPAFWVVIAGVAACAVLAVCFLTNPSSFPVELESIKITEASILDLRTNSGPMTRQLTAAEIDELSSGIKTLKIGSKDQELHGHTPFYSLLVDTEKTGRLTFSGFDSAGNHTAVLYDDVYYRITDSDFIHYLQHVCTDGTTPSAVEKDNISSDLDTAVSAAILQHFTPSKPDGLVHVESHILLANQRVSGTPRVGEDQHLEKETVYLLVLHESFYPDSDPAQPLECVDGDYIPTALTFYLNKSGNYILDEYWEPRDGVYDTDDIKAKFPDEALQKVWNEQNYIATLEAENRDKVKALLKQQGDFTALADNLITAICSSPAVYSNPGDYIRMHQNEYDTLLSYREATLQYCFTTFLEGGQTDLRGQIMAELCRDIMSSLGEDSPEEVMFETGQEWFDAFYVNALNLAAKSSPEDLKKHDPASWLVLEMSGSDLEQPSRIFKTYLYTGSDFEERAFITLYDDGSFQFEFSPVSSYIGRGSYTMEGEQLTLKTNDGQFTYVFHMKEENLIFDAGASSNAVWGSGLEDGSILMESK